MSSGAVAAGRRRIQACGCLPDVDKADLGKTGDLPARQAVSAIGQSRLMHEYDEAFGRYGKVSAQVLLTREDLKSRSRFLNARNTMRRLLDWRVIPVVNENDTVAVQELEFGDNDTLASLCVALVEADLFVNLTSADGVFEANPETTPGAEPLEHIEDIASLDIEAICSGKTAVGSGGMYSKLRAARRAAQLGVPTLIVSGRARFALEKAFEGAKLGTWVEPEAKTVSRRKFWLAYHADPTGELVVDDGAAKALTDMGKSLLPVGIREVNGRFERGALVRVSAASGRTLGLGISNYKASELRRIMGKKCADIAAELGQAPFAEAIHRDNLLLDPAL